MKWLLLTLASSLLLSANEPFISAEKLSTMMKQDKVVILDVGTKEDYLNKGHIPGAVQTEINEWRIPVDKHFLMRSEAELVKKISELGIDNETTVVLYGHNKSKEMLKASYIALTLKVLGHEKVTLLNGGFLEWTFDDERPVSKTAEHNKPAVFKAARQDGIVVDKEFVKSKLYQIPMVEARPSDFYFGTLQSKGVKRIGHISGGMSYYWRNSFQVDETVKSIEEITELLIEGMQLNPEKEMLVYCTGGLEASMNWYVLTQVLGFKDVKIYDASLKEWGNLDDTPMTHYRWEAFSNKTI